MARRPYLPCAVRHITNAITFEETSALLPVPGCHLCRTDGVKGTIAAIHGSTLEVLWQGGNLATYTTVKFGAVI